MLDLSLAIEPLWTWPAASIVYLGIIFPALSVLVLPSLALLLVPFILRRARYGYFTVRTPFDIPICLVLTAAALALLVSHDVSSLWSLATIVAAAFIYYSVVNYGHPRRLWTGIVAGMTAGVAVYGVLAFLGGGPRTLGALGWLRTKAEPVISAIPGWSGPKGSPDSLQDLTHGLALVAAIVTITLVCLALFSRRNAIRVSFVAIGLLFSATAISVATKASFERLASLASLESRGMHRWLPALSQASDHLYTVLLGTGLGGSPSARQYYPLHNAYLEVYLNLGVIGVVAALWAGITAARLSLRGMRVRSGDNMWRGMAWALGGSLIVVALVGLLESSPFSIHFLSDDKLYWMASPIPWLLLAGLVVVRQNLGSTHSCQ